MILDLNIILHHRKHFEEDHLEIQPGITSHFDARSLSIKTQKRAEKTVNLSESKEVDAKYCRIQKSNL